MKNQLQKILNQLDNQNSNKQELGYEALSIIKNILSENPFDIDMLILRMRLNADIFENSSAIIEDASYIIENDQFGKDKMVGYDWLFWVYNEVLAMPDKATETLEEQLIEVHSLFKKQHKKDRQESELLNKLAQLKFDTDLKEVAFSLWDKSLQKHPFLHNRNAFVGMEYLKQKKLDKAAKFLLPHYDWCYATEDGWRLEYGKELKKLYDNKELENQPILLGMLFNIIRNEEEHFKLEGKLDFYEKYFPELEKYANKYPKNSLLWTAIAHTHFFDTKNYEKAFDAFKILAETDDFYRYTNMERVIKTAKKSDNDFFEIPFSFKGYANDNYGSLTDLSEALDKVKKKKKKKKFAELAIAYGEAGYDKFRAYLVDGKGNTTDNHPHVYAMLCNNYANTIGEHAELFYKKEEKNKRYKLAGDIHIEGYKVSPFIENLENASSNYFYGKDYQNAIKYSLEVLKEYNEELSVSDYQDLYWRIVRSYIKLKDLPNAEKYYFKAKSLFDKVGKGAKKANYEFIFTAKLFYEFAIEKQQEYKKYIPELEWFLAKEIALKQEPKEHGLVSYYLGLCSKENNQKDKAITAFQVSVNYLQDADWGFYDEKCDQAEAFINELGGKTIKKKNKKKKKSVFKKTIDAIFFPFMVFGIVGGIIWAAATGNFDKEKKKKR